MRNLTLFLLITFNSSFAQNQNNNWYFGEYTGVDFNSGAPVTINNSVMLQNEGCASISDTSGNLLFYTDGITVWNSINSQMQQGFGLLGHNSSTQSALIVPKPLNCDRYYIFTVFAEDTITPLCYSTVDMTYNGGLGRVVSKNNLLYSPIAERLNATLKSNGRDYWVVAQDADSGSFLVYSVSPTGINPTPQIFSTSSPVSPGPSYVNLRGELKFSSNGSKIAYANYGQSHCVLCDFDNSNGNISNCFTINQSAAPYGIEFSSDNSKLYVSFVNVPFTLIQYDLLAGSPTAIQNSAQVIYLANTSPPYQYGGALQLGPDNKIYVNRIAKHSLGVINQPNLSGNLCNYVDSAIFLSNRCQLGLPNCIKQYSPCSGLISSLDESIQSSRFKIYPNPFSYFTNITFPNKQSELFSLIVYDVNGQVILKKDEIHSNEVQINKEFLYQGIFFFQLISENEIYCGKLIVE